MYEKRKEKRNVTLTERKERRKKGEKECNSRESKREECHTESKKRTDDSAHLPLFWPSL